MVSIASNLHTCNTTALILSAIVLVVCVVYKEALEGWLKRKVPFPIPIDLLIVSCLLSRTALRFNLRPFRSLLRPVLAPTFN